MVTSLIGYSLHHLVLAAPATSSGSCGSIPAEALLAIVALLFALRPLNGKR